HGVAPGDPDAARRLIAPGNEHGGLSLVVTVGPRPAEQLVAVGSYSHTHRPDVAEVAFLVEDAYQGRGIGTLLLERLAMAALEQGLTALEAFVMGENTDMLSVFEASGFTFERGPSPDGWYIQLPLAPTEASVQRMEARDRIATRASLYPFFHPRSVAVIGASRDPASIGYQVLANLILSHYQGPVYPVNPNAPYVMSVPAYPTVLDIPGPVDLAVVAVPQRAVLTVAEQCAQKGVRAMIVLAAGFAETGPAGAELQRQLVDLVRGSGMRMIGPNCLGLIHCHPEVQMNASFASAPARPGSLAMSSQSGALGQAVLEYAHELGIGLSAFVSIGNKADVSSNDLLQWWEEDDQTSAILLYLESFGNPRRFARLARRVSRRKPIVAVKSGRTAAGRRAAGSHTAALASDDAVVDALFQQSGVIRTRTLSEMFDVAALLAHHPGRGHVRSRGPGGAPAARGGPGRAPGPAAPRGQRGQPRGHDRGRYGRGLPALPGGPAAQRRVRRRHRHLHPHPDRGGGGSGGRHRRRPGRGPRQARAHVPDDRAAAAKARGLPVPRPAARLPLSRARGHGPGPGRPLRRLARNAPGHHPRAARRG